MQLSFAWPDPGAAPDEVIFVRHRRARRYLLRVLADGTVRVTVPRWGAKREARAFVEASRAWIAKQREQRRLAANAGAMAGWRDGTELLFDGRTAVIRTPDATGPIALCWGEERIADIPRAPGGLRESVESWMRDRARHTLPPALLALAAAHGIEVRRVSIRNQRSRWGACSPSGTITLNWRLIQAPLFVREYVLLHELMHRREMNHSRRFWKLVAACCPRQAEARHWLRTEGKSLWPPGGGY